MDRPPRLTLVAGLAAILSGCAATPSLEASLRLEDRPADGVVRLHNRSERATTLWYNSSRSFDDGPQMLDVRWRDRDGRVVHFNGTWPELGWWTPLNAISTLHRPGELPRQSLIVPPRGFIDFERDVAWFTRAIRDHVSASGPCAIQFALLAHPRRRSRNRVRLTTEWQPADCPVSLNPPLR